MCRLLMVKSQEEFLIEPMLEKFAEICMNSREYQGHGWGITYLHEGKREFYRSVTPIWDDELTWHFGQHSTRFLAVHARSAFQDKGIDVVNNMPFIDDDYVFIFNGELQGVKIKEAGRIGAEKVFNFIKRFNKGDMLAAMQRAVPLIEKHSENIRAMNMMISDMENVYLCSQFNSEEDYFTMHRKRDGDRLIICSDPFPGETGWTPISNKTISSVN